MKTVIACRDCFEANSRVELALRILASVNLVRKRIYREVKDTGKGLPPRNLGELVLLILGQGFDQSIANKIIDLTIRLFLVLFHGLNDEKESALIFQGCLRKGLHIKYSVFDEVVDFERKLKLVLNRKDEVRFRDQRRIIGIHFFGE